MSKKDFIALADAIRQHNLQAEAHNASLPSPEHGAIAQFTPLQLEALVQFCKQQNSAFKESRWLDYIAGKCGPSGGTR